MKTPIRLNRSPQWSGGVASSRMEWPRFWLRNTQFTSVSANVGTLRISSVQLTLPLRITSSGCEKTQSAPAVSTPSLLESGKPAIQIRPSLERRTSSSGLSMVNCSKPKPRMERADSAAKTEGSFRTSRPWVSSRRTSLSSNAGIRPLERAAMSPIRTLTPSNREACCSSVGRNSVIRGTITKCSAPQTMSNATHAETTSQNAVCTTNAPTLNRGEEFVVNSVIAVGTP